MPITFGGDSFTSLVLEAMSSHLSKRFHTFQRHSPTTVRLLDLQAAVPNISQYWEDYLHASIASHTQNHRRSCNNPGIFVHFSFAGKPHLTNGYYSVWYGKSTTPLRVVSSPALTHIHLSVIMIYFSFSCFSHDSEKM